MWLMDSHWQRRGDQWSEVEISVIIMLGVLTTLFIKPFTEVGLLASSMFQGLFNGQWSGILDKE